ncbi:hypothetical protein BJ508DRAFT_414726 [Ascobolus immersus RN42]|uniref:Uncharacterized protein n=1 Tax=Ascobolus immersus RN42 TaxID=1160509 RepID=A0A3N4I5W0_ASCIM|nr:hypothetical protein BJ508DRAFT_414726 [Ascobolus immersus RN42]
MPPKLSPPQLRTLTTFFTSNLHKRTLASHAPPTMPHQPPSLSVLSTPLQIHSLQPPTGFTRDGFCRSYAQDPGQHTVAAIVTEDFLNFSAERGNNLRTLGPEMKEGCRWCLCVARWKEALDAFRAGKVGRDAVPRVRLEATDRSVLGEVGMGDLKEFQAVE